MCFLKITPQKSDRLDVYFSGLHQALTTFSMMHNLQFWLIFMTFKYDVFERGVDILCTCLNHANFIAIFHRKRSRALLSEISLILHHAQT